MEYRIARDTMGEVKVPKDKSWGAQTQRSLEYFNIGKEKMPEEIIHALAILKKCAAQTNHELGLMEKDIAEAIVVICNEIISGRHRGEFPLSVWQTGSGTQSNMNINEVIAHLGNQLPLSRKIHPNDDVNLGQSSNDSFPTAMHIAAVLEVETNLLPAMVKLESTLEELSFTYKDIIKIGRTHLQDATPITLGQEISGWLKMITNSKTMIKSSMDFVREIAIGGTAVGTGLNTHPDFGFLTAEKISNELKTKFVSAHNKFHSLTSKDALVNSHGSVKALAANLMKISNDIRWLASGPRSGLGEISIPENEPGSSIMPGKVNPTQCEALTMVCCQVFGNDACIGFAASQGNFQLNVYMPVIIYNYLQSIRLLTDSINSFNNYCVKGIVPNKERIKHNLENSLMLITALNPHIGYENAAKIAKAAYVNGTKLEDEAVKLGILTEEEFHRYVRPEDMVSPQLTKKGT